MPRPARPMALLAAAAALSCWAVPPGTSADPLMKTEVLPLAGGSGSSADSTAPLSIRVSSTTAGPAMPAGFLGLSIEFRTLQSYVGGDSAAVDPVFLALVRHLAPGQAPILRIGGDSTDQTWWPVRGAPRPPAVNFALTRRWLAMARATAADLGARLIAGINLAAGRPALAAVEARHLIAGIGLRHISALEIGNEPDLYPGLVSYFRGGQPVHARGPGYTARAYIRQFTRWRTTLPAAGLAGPAFARTSWMSALPAFLRAERRVGTVTFHRYPLRACQRDPQAADYPTIPRLLEDASSSGLAHTVAPFADTAHAAGRRFRLDELNSASCTGRLGVSDTFASALWVLDTLFHLAAARVDGVNVHMLPGSAYQAFSVSHTGSRWRASVKPLYYGMLMFERAFPRGARLLGVSAPGGPVKAWATRGRDGRLRAVLINKSADQPVDVILHLPGQATLLTRQRLSAPSLASRAKVSLGGETFGAETSTGVLSPNPHPGRVAAVGGSYEVSLPAASAILLTR